MTVRRLCCLLILLVSGPLLAKEPPRHWAFVAPQRPAVPGVRGQASGIRNRVDAFVAAKLAEKGLTAAPEADRRTLLRRVTLDLTGLPPTPEEVEAARNAKQADWYDRVVERLLASPAYGERWGRHWLDVARWAESEGYESNHPRPHAWRYRDWVVRAFNADKPYDVFLRQQVAGDEMTSWSDDNLIATGFLAAARLSSNEEDKWRQRNDMLVDVVNATAGAFLGLTLQCAQCHNHKLEPLTQRDYYRFMGFFVMGQPGPFALTDPTLNDTYRKALPPGLDELRRRERELFEAGRVILVGEAKKKMSPELRRALELPEGKRSAEEERLHRQADLLLQFTPERIERNIPEANRKEHQELKKKIAELAKGLPDRPQTFAYCSSAAPVGALPALGFYPLPWQPERLRTMKAHLLHGGDVHRPGPALEPGWPSVLGPVPDGAIGDRPRLALADWLTAPTNPLTARVWANRVWQYHFGRGLVATPSDFGLKGSPPSHPELLDWLACELIDSGWSTKHLHRLIVTSAAYRRASRPQPENEKADPDNLLLWRWLPRRLEAEAIRDAMLTVAGDLDRRAGGASDEENASRRRTLYLVQKRERPPAVQARFDGPSASTESCPCRHTSTVPLQALYLLNNDFALARAQALAQRARERADRHAERMQAAFLLALGRAPDEVERKAFRRFLEAVPDPAQSLVLFSQALLNLNEFVYLE